MTPRDWHALPEEVKNQAISWHVRLASGEVSDGDYTDFASWIAANADNAAAMEWVESIDERVIAAHAGKAAADPLPPTTRIDGFNKRVFENWRFAAIAASFAAVFIISGLVLRGSFTPAGRVEAYAGVGAPLNFALEDGSEVTLAPGARMKVQLDRRHRQVTEFQGAGYFHIAKDAQRPFTVSFDGKTITVVGTQFEVKAFSQQDTVSVAEGVVKVSNKAAEQVTLTAGKSMMMSRADGVEPTVSDVDVSEIGAWRKGVLEFDNAPMSRVLDALNGLYGSETFIDRTDNTAPLTFNGVLQVTEPVLVAKRLEELLPIRAEKIDGRFIMRSDVETDSNGVD